MAYVYRHIRLDYNEPFYIGIGSDINYKRAYNKKGRSYAWKDIAYKIQYKVDIILDELSWEEACMKEIEFIKLYGRKNLNLGSLVNFTDGGEGQINRKDSLETKLKKSQPKSTDAKINMKKSHKDRDYSYLKNKAGAKAGVKKTIEHTIQIQKIADSKKIKIYCPELNLTFNSLTEAGEILKKSPGSISNVLKSKTKKTRTGLTLIKI
jgi:hypothetical protein